MNTPGTKDSEIASSRVGHSMSLLDRLGIHPGSTVLDIGFGKADELLILSRIVGSAGTVYGVEPSDSRVRETLGQLGGVENIRVLIGGASKVPLPDGSVDHVIFKGVLHEVDNVASTTREAERLLKSSGSVVIMDFSPFPKKWLRRSNLRWRLSRPWRVQVPAPDKHPGFSKEDLRLYIENSGLWLQHYEDDFATGHFSGHDVPMFLASARRIP